MKKWMISFCLTLVAMVYMVPAPPIEAISTSSAYVFLYPNQKTAMVGSEAVQLEAPATIIDGSMYVPASFIGATIGFETSWDGTTRLITMKPPGHKIVFSPDYNMIYADLASFPYKDVATITDGKLMVKLTWIAKYLSLPITYNAEMNRVEFVIIQNPNNLNIEGTGNSRPVAKFTTNKTSYRLGEPIKYIDLSYDPDAEGLPTYDWKGNEEVFFKPGKYPVSLQVTDGHGNKSDLFTSQITVEDKPYLSAFEYPIYTKPIGKFIKTDWNGYYANYETMPELAKKAENLLGRTLLVSDSPEEVKEKGILYRDTVDGKGRLYADHVNGTQNNLTFAILAKNPTTSDIIVKTTNKGEVWPSVYAHLIGNEATVDFLLERPYDEQITIPAGQTVFFSKMPVLTPGQGINVIYDVETTGKVEFSFAANDSGNLATFKDLPVLFTNDHLRGTFPVSDINWEIKASDLTVPAKLPLGNGKSDPFIKGMDATRSQAVDNFGNWGVTYHLHMDHPPAMTLMVMAKGGYFKGPFKINGEMVLVPQSGVITAFDGVQIIGRTTGREASLDIEYSPPAGSALPVDLILYPLRNLE